MPSLTVHHVEREICAALRGEPAHPVDSRSFAQMAVNEGVGPLVWQSPGSPALDVWCRKRLQEETRRQLALAAVREAELRRVVAVLADAGADVLLIKGAHLAYTLYADPALRPRNDTDLFVRPGHEKIARRALETLGYERQPAITGTAVQGQTIFERAGVPGTVLDVHWRLAGPIVAADLFDFSQLWRRAALLPRLGPAARAPHLLDAITIAAVHLVAHHPNELGLLWLHDLHVLANALDEAAVDALVGEARSRRVSTVLASALRRAEGRFPSRNGSAILAALKCDESEPSAALLDRRAPSEIALMDLRALRGWRARTSYIAGHLFPPPDYMRRRYAPDSSAPLSWLYATRILSGAGKWFRELGVLFVFLATVAQCVSAAPQGLRELAREQAIQKPGVPIHKPAAIVDYTSMTIEQLAESVDVVLVGTLVKANSYLASTEEDILTDYKILQPHVISGRLPSPSSPVPGPGVPLILTVRGGEMTIHGVQVRETSYYMAAISDGGEYLLFLKQWRDAGRYQIHNGGVFQVGRDELKPLVKDADVIFKRTVGKSLAEMISRIEHVKVP